MAKSSSATMLQKLPCTSSDSIFLGDETHLILVPIRLVAVTLDTELQLRTRYTGKLLAGAAAPGCASLGL